MNLNKPNSNSLIAVCGNWVACTTDGFILYLKNNSGFSHFFRFEIRIAKILFSPTGNTVYIIDINNVIFKRSLTQRSLKNDIDNFVFSVLISLPLSLNFEKYITIIPYEKIIYLIVENTIFMINNGSISNTITVEKNITSTFIIPTEIAKNYKLISNETISLFCIICGASDGTVSTLSFPDNFCVHEEISNPFVLKSEPISLFTFTPKYYCVVGKYGTVECVSASGKVITGSIPFPVSSIFIQEPNFLFVSKSRLYSSPILNPTSFHVLPSFPAKICCSCDKYAITKAGVLLPITDRLISTISPSPELIEFALEELRHTNKEKEKVKSDILEAESHLSDIQLIKSLQSGKISFESDVKIVPSMSPDRRVVVDLLIDLKPVGSFSCNALSILINLTDSLGRVDSYLLPNVQTINLSWKKRVFIVSSSMLKCDIIVSHGKDSALAYSSYFDIIDFSVPIETSLVNLGQNPMSLQRQISSLTFALHGSLPENLVKPLAMQSPTGEIWTMRCDKESCTVSSATQETSLSVKAAVERRVKADGIFSFSDADENIVKLREAADEIISYHVEIVPVRGGIKAGAERLAQNMNEWIDDKLTNE